MHRAVESWKCKGGRAVYGLRVYKAKLFLLTVSISTAVPHVALTVTNPAQGQFRRAYRFPALQPFAVSHRVIQIESWRKFSVSSWVPPLHGNGLVRTETELDCVDYDVSVSSLHGNG